MPTESAALFIANAFRACELQADDVPALQAFFDANPEYFLAVEGRPPTGNAAVEAFHAELPAGWPFTKRWLIKVIDASGCMVAMADVVADLLAARVWHIGLFIVATALHGSGSAQAIYAALQAWIERQGARWIRLGVVAGYTRAERFWTGLGFVEVRQREGLQMGHRANTLRVMAKPLGAATLTEYLQWVARDRPDA